jgi:hypothetical protein
MARGGGGTPAASDKLKLPSGMYARWVARARVVGRAAS